MSPLRTLCCLTFLLLWQPSALPASAAGSNAYQVEVIIFRVVTPPAGEDLTAAAEGRGFEGAAAPGAVAPSVLQQLDASQMQLGGLAARLRTGGTWQVLAHAGWIQTATDWPKHAGLELSDVGLAAPDLHGSIYLERGQQYLHLGVDLQLGSNPTWSLRELRKVKFNEKNYFDHPGFGVIAIVSPVHRAVP
jgi:hypothetical protein